MVRVAKRGPAPRSVFEGHIEPGRVFDRNIGLEQALDVVL